MKSYAGLVSQFSREFIFVCVSSETLEISFLDDAAFSLHFVGFSAGRGRGAADRIYTDCQAAVRLSGRSGS